MQPESDHEIGNSLAFSGVEELEEAARAVGWSIDYRQLRRGAFSAEFTTLEADETYLATERFDNHLHIHCEPPEGFIGLFLPRFPKGRAAACGHALTAGDLIFFPPRSELELVTSDQCRNETLFMPEAEFQAAARALAPSHARLPQESARILHGDPGRLAAIRRDMDSVHRTGSLDSETASNLLAQTILWMADASSSSSAERLTNGNAAAIAGRARTFIEANFRDVVRLQDVCAFAGVGMRTLQRCFATHFQVSPTDYIKARRLNAVRRDLVHADPSSDLISMIARENGFSHLGRFSGEYRAHFGESPSETLRK